jgi:predicted metal-dependent peptidase
MSGSCEHHAPDFLGYLMALPEFEAVYMIDTQIQHVVKKGEKIPEMVYGCGGTDLNPAFKICEDIEQKYKGIKKNFIILTDGEIPEVTNGPKESLTIVFTTHEEVHFKKARRKWMNIHIGEETNNG